jgi:hypothetical protein
MARQMQRSHSVSKPQVEQVEERPERDERAEEMSEQVECCLADIDAVIEEACCLLAEAAEVVEPTPTEEEFTAQRNRLKTIYYAAEYGTDEERTARIALDAYEGKWPQHAHLCIC